MPNKKIISLFLSFIFLINFNVSATEFEDKSIVYPQVSRRRKILNKGTKAVFFGVGGTLIAGTIIALALKVLKKGPFAEKLSDNKFRFDELKQKLNNAKTPEEKKLVFNEIKQKLDSVKTSNLDQTNPIEELKKSVQNQLLKLNEETQFSQLYSYDSFNLQQKLNKTKQEIENTKNFEEKRKILDEYELFLFEEQLKLDTMKETNKKRHDYEKTSDLAQWQKDILEGECYKSTESHKIAEGEGKLLERQIQLVFDDFEAFAKVSNEEKFDAGKYKVQKEEVIVYFIDLDYSTRCGISEIVEGVIVTGWHNTLFDPILAHNATRIHIVDKNGKVIGVIDVKSGKNIEDVDTYLKKLGFYNKKDNKALYPTYPSIFLPKSCNGDLRQLIGQIHTLPKQFTEVVGKDKQPVNIKDFCCPYHEPSLSELTLVRLDEIDPTEILS